MWKLLNRLFGHDYIAWENSADSGIARVFNDWSGKTYYFRYKNTSKIDEIKTPDQVVWLTCHPNKYLNTRANEQQGGE